MPSASSAGPPHQITGLTPETQYRVRVSATNTTGTSTPSAWVTATTDPEATDFWGGRTLLAGPHHHAAWTSPINYGTSFNSNGLAATVLDQDYALGATAIRVDTAWRSDTYEPTQGDYNLTMTSGERDKIRGTIERNKTNGVRTVVCLNESPTFYNGGNTKTLPSSASACFGIGAAWGTIAANYAWTDSIIMEFWNEPNLADFDSLGPRPSHYYDCLVQFYNGVKSTNPDLLVSNGGPESIAVVSGGTAKTDFIGQMYDRHVALGRGSNFPWDLMAVHAYPVTDGPTLNSNGTQNWRFRHLDFLIAEMELRGDPSPIIMTENGYGYHENTDLDGDGVQPWEAGVTPESNVGTLTVALISEAVTRYAGRATNPLRLLILYTDVRKDSPYGSEMSPATNFWRHQSGFGVYRSGKGTDIPFLADITGITSAVRTRLNTLKTTGA